jgi:1-acyl-sn-glycerol-3-phosphate acyltransferase
LVNRKDLTGMVADKYLKHKRYFWIRPLVEAVNGIWINREQADFQALRSARDYLKAGYALGIAPEGTRSHTGALIPAKTGVAYLADKAGVPIVPVAIWGTEAAIAQVLRLRRPHVFIRFGPPFNLPKLQRGDRSDMLQSNTVLIMCRIAAMLPEQYHGVYQDHPCLREMQPAGLEKTPVQAQGATEGNDWPSP